MRHMASYDIMETMRNTNQWMGATAKSFASYPAFAMVPNPFVQWMAAWGEVTERSFERMVVKPDWGLDLIHLSGWARSRCERQNGYRTPLRRFDTF